MKNLQYNMAHPYFPKEDIPQILQDIRDILEGKNPLSMGPKVAEFEKAFAHYCGVRFAVATNSCSAALEISLRSLGLKQDDEVIVPIETFFATGASVLREGGKISFAGIDPQTFCLSLNEIKKACSNKTKAVILVHMAGLVTPEVEAIADFCKQKGIALIEDAAHAPGASFNGKKSGSFGNMACFSFYPTKIMTTGEGGMIVTNDEGLYQQANSYRHRGRDMAAPEECYRYLGTNNRMTEIQAVLGLAQLNNLENFVTTRNKIAQIYNQVFQKSGVSHFIPVLPDSRCFHAYWRYIVTISERIDREKLRELVSKKGIALDWAYNPPLHRQPFFQNLSSDVKERLTSSEKIMKNFICLPIHSCMKEEEAHFVACEFIESSKSLL